MMSLFFSDRAHFIDERERLAKVRKFELAHDVMPIDHFPLRSLFLQILEFFPGQWRNSSAAGYARFIR
jgi:hypothetical protein